MWIMMATAAPLSWATQGIASVTGVFGFGDGAGTIFKAQSQKLGQRPFKMIERQRWRNNVVKTC